MPSLQEPGLRLGLPERERLRLREAVRERQVLLLVRPTLVSLPKRGHYRKAGVEPRRWLREHHEEVRQALD